MMIPLNRSSSCIIDTATLAIFFDVLISLSLFESAMESQMKVEDNNEKDRSITMNKAITLLIDKHPAESKC